MKWTDIADPTESETAQLSRDHDFHPLDLQDCLNGKVTKVEDHGDHLFLLLHFPEEDDKGIVVSNRVSIFLGIDYIVTLHPGNLSPLSQLFDSCREDEEKRTSLMKSSAYVAYRIIDSLEDVISSILDDIQGKLLNELRKILDGKEADQSSIQQARCILNATREVNKDAQEKQAANFIDP